MNGADLLQIRFGSGTGLDAQVFYVRKQVLQDFSFEQLCHSVHELLGNPLEQFFGPDPILELQVCGCTLTADDMSPAAILMAAESSCNHLDVVIAGQLGSNTLQAAEAALQDDEFRPNLVKRNTSNKPGDSFSWQIHVSQTHINGYLHGEAIAGFQYDATCQLELELRSCQDEDTVYDKLADVIIATQAQPAFEAYVDPPLQAWAEETVSIRKYVKSSGEQCQHCLYLMPYKSAKGVRFLGFYVLPVAVQEARRLRQHIKLALDLDETLVNAHENAALQVFQRQCAIMSTNQASPVRDKVTHFIADRHTLKATANFIRHRTSGYSGDGWCAKVKAAEYLDKQLQDVCKTGRIQYWDGRQMVPHILCEGPCLEDLPSAPEVETACAVNHLLLKLSRVWLHLEQQFFNKEQLQMAVNSDVEIKRWAPGITLTLTEADLQTFDCPKRTARIQLSGVLLPGRSPIQDTAAFTYYETHVKGKWCRLICMVRPGVQHMLDKLCSQAFDCHICDVAVCTAAEAGYAHAVCAVLDPKSQHILQQGDRRFARVYASVLPGNKALEEITHIPRAAVLMDDCPDLPHLQPGTVWKVSSQRVRIPMTMYIPGCDQGDMQRCEAVIRKVQTRYAPLWGQFRDEVRRTVRDGPDALRHQQTWDNLSKCLPSTEAAVHAAIRSYVDELQEFRARSSGSGAGSVLGGAGQHDMADQTSPAQPSAQLHAQRPAPISNAASPQPQTMLSPGAQQSTAVPMSPVAQSYTGSGPPGASLSSGTAPQPGSLNDPRLRPQDPRLQPRRQGQQAPSHPSSSTGAGSVQAASSSAEAGTSSAQHHLGRQGSSSADSHNSARGEQPTPTPQVLYGRTSSRGSAGDERDVAGRRDDPRHQRNRQQLGAGQMRAGHNVSQGAPSSGSQPRSHGHHSQHGSSHRHDRADDVSEHRGHQRSGRFSDYSTYADRRRSRSR